MKRELVPALAGALAVNAFLHEQNTSTPNDERYRRQLEAALRCERGHDEDARRHCFAEAVWALNLWSAGPARDAAYSQAEATFERWPDQHRAVGTSAVLWESERRVLDTTRLVRTLEDWYPDDTDRTNAERTLLTIHSPLARDITHFSMVRAPVSYRWFNEGPGLSRLRSLALREVGDWRNDFGSLLRWSSLQTLEAMTLSSEGDLLRGESLWAVLRAASSLRALTVMDFGASEVPRRLRDEPPLSNRLRELALISGYLSSREVDALVDNRALHGLTTLDLRGNSLTDSDVARLRNAPQFARTQLLVGPRKR